jgi:hypothetical protein
LSSEALARHSKKKNANKRKKKNALCGVQAKQKIEQHFTDLSTAARAREAELSRQVRLLS